MGSDQEDDVEASDVGPRRRRTGRPRWEPQPGDWDPEIPYGGKVYLARKKRRDSWFCVVLQLALVVMCLAVLYALYYHGDWVHMQLTHTYAAYVGDQHAQHHMGHRYLHGKGVATNHALAMEWFQKAADQGHPEATYNWAVGRLKGLHSNTKPGEVETLIRQAAESGVEEAKHVLEHVCKHGKCDV